MGLGVHGLRVFGFVGLAQGLGFRIWGLGLKVFRVSKE